MFIFKTFDFLIYLQVSTLKKLKRLFDISALDYYLTNLRNDQSGSSQFCFNDEEILSFISPIDFFHKIFIYYTIIT